MQDVIDIHCHFITFDYLPDAYTVHLIRNSVKGLSKLVTEDFFSHPDWQERLLIKIVDRLGVHYLEEFLNSLRVMRFRQNPTVIDTLVAKGEYFTAGDIRERHLKGKQGRQILFTPLMMDFIKASNIGPVTEAHGVMPYADQIAEHSFLAVRHPWQVLPFFHFHPQRDNALALCKTALESQGFMGIKLYPAMGYYPQWDKNQDPMIRSNLKALYEWIREKRKAAHIDIPVTVHAQNNATQAIDLKTAETRKYTAVSNWETVIEEFGLKINFGHYGGTDFLTFSPGRAEEKAFSAACRESIRDLMARYNINGRKRIFADVSAHTRRPKKYFQHLNADLKKPDRLLMFGTDLPVISAATLNRDYINDYMDKLASDAHERFFKTHALEFLFGNGQVPETYIRFLKTNRDKGLTSGDPLSGENLPKFVRQVVHGKTYEIQLDT